MYDIHIWALEECKELLIDLPDNVHCNFVTEDVHLQI